MLKRTTKITGLLMAMASIISIAPAKADDSVKKIETKEGTVYNAYAKGPGMLIDAEINEKDEALYYVSADGKFHEIDSDDSWDNDYSGKLYVNNRYVGIADDSYIDLQDNYKVVDDKISDNVNDDADEALRRNIKKDDDERLNEDEYDGTNGIKTANSYPSTYSPYSYKLKNARVNGATTTTIYGSNVDGSYVDADYNIGSLKVNTTGGSVTIKNTEDTYEVKDGSTTYEYKSEIKERKYLNQNDNVYRLVDLYIFKKIKGSDDSTYTDVTDEVTFGGTKYAATNVKNDSNGKQYVTVFQKFSVAQASGDIDGLKYAKDSSLYFITDEDGNSENVLGFGSGFNGKIGGTSRFAVNATLGLTSSWSDDTNGKIYCETVTPKSKNGYNYLDLSDNDNTDFDAANNNAGQTWILSKGYIKTWDTKAEEFVNLYKVDGGMNKMSAGSKGDIIVWNEDDEIYSIIATGGIAATGTTTTTTGAATTVAKGWTKAADGTWSYNKADGTKATGWLQDGAWYYLKVNGVMATGWINDNGNWYYLNASGAMQTGWINDNGNWYYCNASGAMLTNTVVEGYYVGANGVWVK
ncbi:N-acetylmuramoyl-L-alanine amidase family protein [Clostridium beijerinckii]|uniref:N-acetylmuramoyl-L-alanine amidase family protein n=1 Tax=Clostridium beijerinckii TaxID=1520 RepID=UPI00156F0EEC|nr:N-acetylmuramoyl-L-alanine amidase family protein [Clostridium beijerinckii]NRT71437.1 glucan-binding YG repeat protein [Clostridium beijerinckii]